MTIRRMYVYIIRRRCIASILVTLGMMTCIELVAILFLAILEKQLVLFPQPMMLLVQHSLGMMERNDDRLTQSAFTLHPYVGYVRYGHQWNGTGADAIKNYGFGTQIDVLQKRDDSKVIVAILGASVAEETMKEVGDVFHAVLQAYPVFADKEIIVLPLAVGGYKQPQQLSELNYLLSIGAEFDIIVNIDGVGEVVIPPVHNVQHGIAAAYPMDWFFTSKKWLKDQEQQLLLGQISYLSQKRKEYAAIVQKSSLRYSHTALFLWRALDQNLENKVARRMDRLISLKPDWEEESTIRGPAETYETEDEMIRELADIWFRSSLLLDAVSRSQRMTYVHILQPNQYVPGSKVIRTEEQEVAMEGAPHIKKWIQAGYPVLRDRGAQLHDRGIHFYDFTMIFENISESLYRDNCCHLNKKGSLLLAEQLADVVAAEYGNDISAGR